MITTVYAWLAVLCGVSIIGGSLIQISPLKINPWTALGNAFNKDIIVKIDSIDAKVNKMQADFSKQAAENYRTKILRFGDELIDKKKHTKEHFDTILDAITSYKDYCDKHPEFQNERTVIITQHIKAVYKDCLENNSFLKEE